MMQRGFISFAVKGDGDSMVADGDWVPKENADKPASY